MPFIVCIDEAESMAAESMHVPVAIRRAPVTHQE